ncbi:MAG: hypothetical protein AAF552_14820 [Pseudomonadota bacterium]
MKQRHRLSRRELWLVSLLPAALVVIVSMGLPKGKVSEIPDLERRLTLLTSDEAVQRRAREQRELTDELRDRREALAALTAREKRLQARLDALLAPGSSRASAMAQGLDRLTRQLGNNGVQVLGMLPQGGSGRLASTTRPALSATTPRTTTASSASTSGTPARRLSRRQRRAAVDTSNRPGGLGASRLTNAGTIQHLRWQVGAAATWSAMGEVLMSADNFPPGLALSALTMDPASRATPLRRWELTVTDAGVVP